MLELFVSKKNNIKQILLVNNGKLIERYEEEKGERRNEGKLEEKRSTLKEQLIIKLGAVSSRLEEQLTNASLEKLNGNIFDITSEEDALRIIH